MPWLLLLGLGGSPGPPHWGAAPAPALSFPKEYAFKKLFRFLCKLDSNMTQNSGLSCQNYICQSVQQWILMAFKATQIFLSIS